MIEEAFNHLHLTLFTGREKRCCPLEPLSNFFLDVFSSFQELLHLGGCCGVEERDERRRTCHFRRKVERVEEKRVCDGGDVDVAVKRAKGK